MLLVVCDDAVHPQERMWCSDALRAGLESVAGPVSLAGDLTGIPSSGAPAGSSVVWLSCGAERARIEAAAAAASEILMLIAVAAGFRSPLGNRSAESAGTWQFIGTLTAPRIAVWLCAADAGRPDPIGEIGAALGAHRSVRIRQPGSRKAHRQMHRLGRSLVTAACAPQRLDRSDGVVRRQNAAGAATDALETLLSEPDVEEFQIRGGESMIVQYSGGRIERRPSPFATDEDLIEAVRFMAAYSGDRPQRFDELDPRLDVRIGERWRLHAEAFVTSPPNVVLRSNLAGRMRLPDLGFVSPELGSILIEAIAGRTRANVVVAAAMGGGKTTLCQALLAAVPDNERIDTIEDTPELRLAAYGIHPNTFERLTRDPNQDGHGRHSMADHIRDAKRANASKLVVGEIRGDGCEALLDAMSSGIDGCLVTLHSQAGKGVLEKLVAYACSEGAEPDYARRQIAAAVDLCVWMGRNSAGQRVVADVTQLTGIDEVTGVISTECLWALRPGERWATPVRRPVGRVERIYESAGFRVDGGTEEHVPTLFSRIADSRPAAQEASSSIRDGSVASEPYSGAQPAPEPQPLEPARVSAQPRSRTATADDPIRTDSPSAISSPPEDRSEPDAVPPMFDAVSMPATVSDGIIWDPGPLVPIEDSPPYEPLVPEPRHHRPTRAEPRARIVSEHRDSAESVRGPGGEATENSVPC